MKEERREKREEWGVEKRGRLRRKEGMRCEGEKEKEEGKEGRMEGGKKNEGVVGGRDTRRKGW